MGDRALHRAHRRSIYGIIWVTSRIYRVGVLMYGKRPNIPEILRWLKYS